MARCLRAGPIERLLFFFPHSETPGSNHQPFVPPRLLLKAPQRSMGAHSLGGGRGGALCHFQRGSSKSASLAHCGIAEKKALQGVWGRGPGAWAPPPPCQTAPPLPRSQSPPCTSEGDRPFWSALMWRRLSFWWEHFVFPPRKATGRRPAYCFTMNYSNRNSRCISGKK